MIIFNVEKSCIMCFRENKARNGDLEYVLVEEVTGTRERELILVTLELFILNYLDRNKYELIEFILGDNCRPVFMRIPK